MAKRVLNSVLNNQTNTLYWAGVDDQGWGAKGYQYFDYNLLQWYGSDITAFSASRWGCQFIIKSDNTLWSWGNNYIYGGILGNGNTNNVNSPTQIGSDTNWSKIWAGYQHALAIKTDGTLWSWGSNGNGQLGLNFTSSNSSPVQVGTDTDWNKLPIGNYSYDHSAAIKTDGTLWTWGKNNLGQLAQNDVVYRSSPTQVGANLWLQVSMTGDSCAAIKNDNTLWTWGSNDNGQLAHNDVVNRSSMVQVGTDTDWSFVCIGNDSIFALKSTGTLWSAGRNIYGRLGLGDTVNRSVLTQVSGTWDSVYAGYYGTLAVKSDGTLWGMGYNVYGSLSQGDITDRTSRVSPVQIGAASDWTSCILGSGFEVHFAVKSGNLYVSGWDEYTSYFPGIHQDAYETLPASTFLSNVKTIVTAYPPGYTQFFVVKHDGTLWSWGYNNAGSLGQNDYVYRWSATQVGTDTNWSDIVCQGSSASSVYALKTDSTLWVWGYGNYGALGLGDIITKPSPVQLGSDTWTSISAGRFHFAGVKTNGTLWTWGRNNVGQLGHNDIVDRSSPVQVGTDTTWSKVAYSQYENVIALKTDGTLWSWGYNAYYNLGLGDQINRSSPVQIGTDTNWANVFAGVWGGIAIKTTGTAWGWGWNGSGHLGMSGAKSIPTQINSDTDWSSFSIGYETTFGVKNNGTIWGAGDSGFNQLGLGISVQSTSTFTQIGSSTWTKAFSVQRLSYFIP